jgi:CRISPR-associated protein Csb1
MNLTYAQLRDAVHGGYVGIRARTTLQPLGGPGDKIFPPTYATSGLTKYALENRRIGGDTVPCVLVDSVASQANRMEAVLLAAARSGRVPLPYVTVDFSDTPVADLDEVTSLQAPHRVYDAILRDSLLDGKVFRLSGPGLAITEATLGNAIALFQYAPTTLLFGGWDSTGPKGGLGSKVERAITSELVGINVSTGVKVGSRLDPLGIETHAGPLYQAQDGAGLKWTANPDEAVLQKSKPVLFDQRGGEGKAGNPSKVNHANIAPSIDQDAGGVTVDEVRGTTVLSFIQLRRISLPTDQAGQPIDGEARAAAETAARTALAALGLLAMVLAFEEGYDLRSRCVLVADGELNIELVGRGSEVAGFSVSAAEAIDVFNEAVAAVREVGLPWDAEPLRLVPAAQLVDLVQRSREITVQSVADDD